LNTQIPSCPLFPFRCSTTYSGKQNLPPIGLDMVLCYDCFFGEWQLFDGDVSLSLLSFLGLPMMTSTKLLVTPVMQTLLLVVYLVLALVLLVLLPNTIAFYTLKGCLEENKLPSSSPAFFCLVERNKKIMMTLRSSCQVQRHFLRLWLLLFPNNFLVF
jgi:hypothetical protein